MTGTDQMTLVTPVVLWINHSPHKPKVTGLIPGICAWSPAALLFNVCLFVWILYIPVNNLSVMSGQFPGTSLVEPVLSSR